MDMKRNFNAIVRRFGHDIYLQRCLNPEVENQAPQYKSNLEKWTIYSMFPNRASGAAGVAQQETEGNVYNVDMVFYFQDGANPNSADRIYEEVDRFPNKSAVYEVDYAIPIRGVGGKIVFWEVGASRLLPR